MNPLHVTPPEQLERALQDLLRGWPETVFAELTATDDYWALTQQVNLDTEASFEGGTTPYQAVIFALAPVFAAHDEELRGSWRCPTTSTRPSGFAACP